MWGDAWGCQWAIGWGHLFTRHPKRGLSRYVMCQGQSPLLDKRSAPVCLAMILLPVAAIGACVGAVHIEHAKQEGRPVRCIYFTPNKPHVLHQRNVTPCHHWTDLWGFGWVRWWGIQRASLDRQAIIVHTFQWPVRCGSGRCTPLPVNQVLRMHILRR